jgi:hypothetical protein
VVLVLLVKEIMVVLVAQDLVAILHRLVAVAVLVKQVLLGHLALVGKAVTAHHQVLVALR